MFFYIINFPPEMKSNEDWVVKEPFFLPRSSNTCWTFDSSSAKFCSSGCKNIPSVRNRFFFSNKGSMMSSPGFFDPVFFSVFEHYNFFETLLVFFYSLLGDISNLGFHNEG